MRERRRTLLIQGKVGATFTCFDRPERIGPTNMNNIFWIIGVVVVVIAVLSFVGLR